MVWEKGRLPQILMQLLTKKFQIGFGFMVRGLMGEILASKTALHNDVSFPFAAEAYAGL
ncbi:hypothetical protein Gohar_012239 [Gossypium harknessii]|uniref:Uncharacterized protein n=1 Tax=Gossypium harknessii TaxID=34285 RepID=A0A7J9GWN2_9ROSI|nr:hypothetical protein [Gossypium harknessii]